MHYKNGREAHNGDKIVILPPWPGTVPVAGILYDAVFGNDNCNGRVAITSQNDGLVNLAECLHFDDLLAATVPDTTSSTDPASPATPTPAT